MPSEKPSAPSVRELLNRAAARLRGCGSDTPRLDAELLLGEALGLDRAGLLLAAGEPVAEADAASFRALIDRRARHEPVAYILGRRAFHRIELAVDPRVLIPRPETELLVEVGRTLPRGARVADVGTGSGAIALALAHERPDLRIIATDTSLGALELARANAATLRLNHVEFRHGDLLAPVPEPVDAVLANLPYVEADAALPPDVAEHEPREALFAGRDGLALIRRLIAALAPGRAPVVGLEVGEGQASAVTALLRAAGYEHLETLSDLAGIARAVVARPVARETPAR